MQSCVSQGPMGGITMHYVRITIYNTNCSLPHSCGHGAVVVGVVPFVCGGRGSGRCLLPKPPLHTIPLQHIKYHVATFIKPTCCRTFTVMTPGKTDHPPGHNRVLVKSGDAGIVV